MNNKVNYVCAGAEGLFRNGDWVFDLERMPVKYYLYNAANYIGKANIEQATEQRDAANAAGKIMMVDSGGFQLATGVINSIDPVGVIDIQNRLGDIGFILDVPTMKRVAGAAAGAGGLELDNSDDFFQQCLERTVQNIRLAKTVKKDFAYYGIIQGVTYDQLCKWYDTIAKEDVFAGVGTKGIILEQLLMGLFFTEEHPEIKRHHVLGLGAAPRVLLMKYFYLCSGKTMDCLTFDNTNHIQYGKFMQLVFPFCNCTYGKGLTREAFTELTDVTLAKDLTDADEILFGSIKNIYLDGMACQFINMMDDIRIVRDFIKANYKDLLRWVQCIDDYFEHGIGYVLKNYTELDFKVIGKQSKGLRACL